VSISLLGLDWLLITTMEVSRAGKLIIGTLLLIHGVCFDCVLYWFLKCWDWDKRHLLKIHLLLYNLYVVTLLIVGREANKRAA